MGGLRHPYTWGRDRPLVVDGLIALAVAGFGVVTEVAPETQQVPYEFRDADAFSIGVTLTGCLPLVLRRRAPVPVYVAAFAAMLVLGAAEYGGGGPWLASMFGLYATAAYGRRLWALLCLASGVAAGAVSIFLVPYEQELPEVVATFALPLVFWILGDNMRIRRNYVESVEDRAVRLEREQDVLARQAVMEERGRIARELHDIVAHAMSVMVIQAGAARRTLARDREQATVAIGHIEATGRGALAEMRRLVGVLRSEGEGQEGGEGELLPQPGVADLGRLAARCQDAGLAVTLSVEGGERPLPEGLELVVYRVVQEALTNVMKHAGPVARARATLTYEAEALSVEVVDDGRGASAGGGPEPSVLGHGLSGMVERVALYNGEVSWGPRRGGGFRVRARLPLNPGGPAEAGGISA